MQDFSFIPYCRYSLAKLFLKIILWLLKKLKLEITTVLTFWEFFLELPKREDRHLVILKIVKISENSNGRNIAK